ncbi:hypothetical protein TREMEDRAFT_64341 [Tremella mesenterica DSM 1558]|uniref:uncharacterized protein n=1 Tax=Tremella mesenterica (strain ATCC 24925 / CBS 8224 / DSM 1558 / NBRC 9311 / NRRL Y-6157 / RJB 2259-6 / UBC 559-6) TaxID=578456 RepID=UPI0003F49FCB|nr:uncharacterized protein TREMEDRAFT_64341 [Tremella mesenterica DSM 1558]EIW67749.1 hypothetical protein TREMEDRAFT_64341 [Tremella mesenterica DSM 1558]
MEDTQMSKGDIPDVPAGEKGGVSTDEIRALVEQEQALADAQRKITTLEAAAEKARNEKQVLEVEKNVAVSAQDQLRTQLSSLQSSFHKASSELSVLQTRVQITEKEKRELLEETERLQQRLNRNAQDLYTLRAQKTDSSQKIAHLDVEVSELKMAAESAKFNEQRSVQALQASRVEILNLNKSLTDVEERFGKYRAEQQAELSRLEMELSTAIARLTSIENNHRSLQRTFNDQSRRLADAHANIATLTSAAASKKASTSLEIHRLVDENRVLEKRGDDARAVIMDREAELERLTMIHSENEKSWSEKWKKEERFRKEAEKRVEDLKLVVERLALAGGDGSGVSPAAALASEIRQSGKSYTQFFTDYQVQETKLRQAEEEVRRLENLLDQITDEIAEKQPLLEQQSAEHSQAIDRANALASELASTLSSRDSLESQLKSIQASSTYHNEEVLSLRQETSDLSRQVQTLLHQISIRDNPSLSSISLDSTSIVSDTGDIITDHLLEFRSLRSLQEQNQKLLRLTRGLMQKLDEREIRRVTTEQDDINVGESLDQATETIKKLHTQLIECQKKILEVTRERDFFSKLLAKGEGLGMSHVSGKNDKGPLEDGQGVLETTVGNLQTELGIIKVKAEKEIGEVREEMMMKSRQAGAAEVEKAKALAKVSLLEEQQRISTETHNLQKQELASLESQLRTLQANIVQAHSERRQALEQLAVRQAESDRLRNEVAAVRAEKDLWQSTENRLQADFRTVQSERAKLQQLIDNLNTVHSENERTRVDERAGYERRIEELQRDSTALRTQIQQARDAARAAEKRAEEFDSRLASSISAVQSELASATSLASSRDQQLTELRSELERIKAESENRHRIGMNWKRRAEQLVEEAKMRLQLLDDQSKELENIRLQASELETLRSQGTELERLRSQTSEVETLRGQLEELKGKSKDPVSVQEKDTELEDVKKKLEGLQKELEETRVKLGEAERKLVEAERVSSLKEMTVQRLQSEMSSRVVASGGAGNGVGVEGDGEALRAERDELQRRLIQAEKDLEVAKAAGSGVSSGMEVSGGESVDESVRELQMKVEVLQREKEELEQRYEANVTRVNKANIGLRSKVSELGTSQSIATNRITELEKELLEIRSSTSAMSVDTVGVNNQVIEEAVKKALENKQVELDELRNQLRIQLGPQDSHSVLKEGSSGAAGTDEGIKEERKKMEKEFQDQLESRQKQIEELQSKVKALERQVKTAEITRKTLERQKIEAEAKAKKMEGEAEAGSSTAQNQIPVSSSNPTSSTITSNQIPPASAFTQSTTSTPNFSFVPSIPALGQSSAQSVGTPSAGQVFGQNQQGVTSTDSNSSHGQSSGLQVGQQPSGQEAATTGESGDGAQKGSGNVGDNTNVSSGLPTRGMVRGRGRSVRGRAVVGTRPNPVLNAVNAALSQTSLVQSVKRPLVEEGEIEDSLESSPSHAQSHAQSQGLGQIQGQGQSQGLGLGQTQGEAQTQDILTRIQSGPRMIKRPRGVGRSRGGGLRRVSGETTIVSSGQITSQPGQPVQPSQLAQPGQPAQPGQSGQLAQPSQPGQTGQIAQPGQIGQIGQIGQPGQSGQTDGSTQTTGSSTAPSGQGQGQGGKEAGE